MNEELDNNVYQFFYLLNIQERCWSHRNLLCHPEMSWSGERGTRSWCAAECQGDENTSHQYGRHASKFSDWLTEF